MKKLFSLLLFFIMLLPLCACTNSGSQEVIYLCPDDHNYTLWEVSGDMMVRECTKCDAFYEREIDREILGLQYIVGTWSDIAKFDYDTWTWTTTYPDGFRATFSEDGSVSYAHFSAQQDDVVFFDYDPNRGIYYFGLSTESRKDSIAYYEEEEILTFSLLGASFACEKTSNE